MSVPERQVWADVLLMLEREHPEVCRRWFRDLEPVGIAEGMFYARTNHDTHRAYLERQCGTCFDEAIRAVTGRLLSVSFLGHTDDVPEAVVRARMEAESARRRGRPARPEEAVNGAAHARRTPRPAGPPAAASAANGASPAPSETEAKPVISIGSTPKAAFHRARTASGVDDDLELPIDPDRSFEHFVIGPENRIAHAAAEAVAKLPARAYNPLFIHGGVGLGKTHLLQAICLCYLNTAPDMRILYTSCNRFVESYADAVAKGEMHDFRHRFRDVDCLVIDDIHFLEKREKSQEEFFHTFNALYETGRQIVMSSDAAPADIPDLVPRLVSRFQSGLVTKVNPTLYETRVEIVLQKAKVKGVEVKDDIATFIASRFEGSVRELEGALNTVLAQAAADNAAISLDIARRALGDAIEDVRPEPSISAIIDAVVRHFGVKITDLQSRRRHKSVVHPRQVCMYLMKKGKKLSLEEIGGYFGGRDHTTVLHAVRTIEAQRRDNGEFNRVVESLMRQLGIPDPEAAVASPTEH